MIEPFNYKILTNKSVKYATTQAVTATKIKDLFLKASTTAAAVPVTAEKILPVE